MTAHNHTTSIVLAVDPEGDTRYRPKCTCGWEGALVVDRDLARSAAFVHREGERLRLQANNNNDPDNT